MRFARAAPVRGRLALIGRATLVATLDNGGVGAFDATSGDPLWSVPELPPLACTTEAEAYAYGRAGSIVCLEPDGTERWRAELPDDRSEHGRERGDREGPFAADVVPDGDRVAVAAREEVIVLDRMSGALRARSSVASGVIDRLAGDGDGLVCICGERTEWDDERKTAVPLLWQPGQPLEQRRTAPGEAVALAPDLGERWRSSVPFDDIVLTGLRPALLAGLVLIAGAGVQSDESGRHRSAFHHRLLAFGREGGELLWTCPLTAGRGRWDPLVTSEGVVAGGEHALYDTEGIERWRLDAGALKLDADVRPTADGERLLFVGDGRVLEADAVTGEIREGPAFARRPFAGALTTTLAVAVGSLCAGVREATNPIELRAVELAR